MTTHRTRPLILWLAALAILWGLLRPSLNAFMASGAGKALVTGCIDARNLLALENGYTGHLGARSSDDMAQADLAVAAFFAQFAAVAILVLGAQAAVAFPDVDLPSTGVILASHPSRAPPQLA
ncbi:DUF2946 family protein [Massilia sp.]|uniref:DUF2946 family protein n=1 Tax=Massilia sp. TaxID=1882437 RepID=UPI0028A18EFA|nr:DUF2946 family protein [Massilia sp.]